MTEPSKPPRYFHLLWDADLDDLRAVSERILERRGEVLSRWYELYRVHLGDERTLSESEFRKIFEPALGRNQNALLRRDMDAYAAGVLTTGRQLAQHHVPVDELIAAAHLLEEATQAVFPKNALPSTEVYNKFYKLSHIHIILLMGAYSGTESAAAALRIDALELEARSRPAEERTRFHGLVGQSPAMRGLYRRIEAAAHSADPLLIVAEAGAGKESVARTIHACGAHQSGPFVVVRCRALPGYLIDTELFGYQRQGSDGAQTYLGHYGAAQGGTLLLDEITSLPMDVQDKLASILDRPQADGERRRVRILASTSRDPEEASRVGQMHKDFGRLFAGRVWRIPPLRERREDIALLARHFVDLLNHRMSRNPAVAGIDDAALEMLKHHPWPGNVRELFEAIRCAFTCTRSALIGPADLPAAISGINGRHRQLPTISFKTFADAERAVLKRALEMTGGNKLRAARMLKISRKKLYSGIAKYGLKTADT